MESLRDVLLQVQAGKKSFSPEASTAEAVRLFQPTASALKHADNVGYLSAVFQQSKMIDTHGCILRAIVTSPLSYEGLRFLESSEAVATDLAKTKDIEIVQIKPGIWRVSVDLKAAYKKVAAHFRRKDVH